MYEKKPDDFSIIHFVRRCFHHTKRHVAIKCLFLILVDRIRLFHLTAGEAGLEGFLLGDAEIDQLGFGAYRAVGVIDLGIDEGHVAHHVVDAGADGYQIQLGGDGLEVLDVHLGGHSGGL